MHGIAIPTAVTWQNKRWKPSIQTSQDCFFINVTDDEQMQKELKKKLKSCDSKELEYYPIIFGVGEGERNISTYVVALHDVFYSFETFIEAMDAAFKCYIFYRIKFPPQVVKFWTFINHLFYKINHPQLVVSAPLASITNSLNRFC